MLFCFYQIYLKSSLKSEKMALIIQNERVKQLAPISCDELINIGDKKIM